MCILMDIKNSLDFRHYRYTKHNNTGKKPYDYASEGLLKKTLPKILFKGNPLLVSYLQMIDMRLIMMFKYIDKLKHFKHITWY